MFRRTMLVAVLAAAICTLIGPAQAQAATLIEPCLNCGSVTVKQRVSDNPSYKGWGYVDANYCAPGMACIMLYRMTVPAWRWTGSQWVSATRPTSQRVYIWPFGYGYSWTWTAETGWLAVSQGYLFIGTTTFVTNPAI